jgi:hypothetical protein
LDLALASSSASNCNAASTPYFIREVGNEPLVVVDEDEERFDGDCKAGYDDVVPVGAWAFC